MTKLTPHFSKEEFELSDWAQRHNEVNIMDDKQLDAATRLCEEVLEPLRKHFKSPVVITSGFRDNLINQGIGGSVSSQHRLGEAADIRVLGHHPFEVACWLAEESDIDFDQCIYEYDSWVHVSHTVRYSNRNQVLTINSKGVSVGTNA